MKHTKKLEKAFRKTQGSMKIALEAKRFFESGTGFGTYSRTLVGDLAANFSENQYFLYAPDAERNLDIASMAHSAEIERMTSESLEKIGWPVTYRIDDIISEIINSHQRL